MAKPTADLLSEQGLLNAGLGVAENAWKQRFADYKKGYDAAYNTVSGRLDDAGKTLANKGLFATVAKIADIAVKPFGVYGMIASVALAGLNEIVKGGIRSNEAIKLKAPDAASFSADLEKTAEKMFERLKLKNFELARQANRQRYMDAGEYRSAKSLLLSSPIWYPPPELEDGLVARRMEAMLWYAYFAGLYQAGYASHELRFLDPIVAHIMDEGYVSVRQSAGWDQYPTPISQGGPGDWLDFVNKTHLFWSRELDEHAEKAWLTPMPVIPENAKIKKSVNWTVPKAYTFAAPTQSGRATIRIETVEMTLYPPLDWSDIPLLQKKQ